MTLRPRLSPCPVRGTGRWPAGLSSVLALLVLLLSVPAVQAQVPVAPTVERAAIEIRRGADIVQPPTVVYKRVLKGQDPALLAGDSLGVLKVPRPRDLDAIQYNDSGLGFTVNLQHAMVVNDGQIVDVEVTDRAVGRLHTRSGMKVQDELILIRPPAEDAFDIAIPDGLNCKLLVPGSSDDLATRGRLYGDLPCKQVQGVETVIDVSAWYDASLTNTLSGIRAQVDPLRNRHNARELRGWLRSLAPGGEQVRFVLVVTPPKQEERVTLVLRDTVEVAPVAKVEGLFRIEEVSVSGFEWITTLAAMSGPNRSDLPGVTAPRYRANRLKGDAITTLRWRASPDQRYEVTFFGSTQASISDQSVGNHHDVPYGMQIAARFGQPGETGFELRLEGSYEDDPFQRSTLARGDQRIRVLGGLDHGNILLDRTHWRVSVGPTYFVDRVNIWEVRNDARQLGYTAEGVLQRNVSFGRLPAILSAGAQLHQSWGYVQDAGNDNLTLTGRLSAKPRLNLGGTTIAVGPVVYLAQIQNNYADIPGFDESNVQFGLELTSWITF